MKEKKLLNYITITSILSILVSIYLIYLHYSRPGKRFCDIGALFSCDVVNKSIYSLFPPTIGIPVSVLGLIFFVILLVLSRIAYKNPEEEKYTINYLYLLTIFSLFFAFYLLFIEIFILKTFCMGCLALDVLIIITLALTYKLKHQTHV